MPIDMPADATAATPAPTPAHDTAPPATPAWPEPARGGSYTRDPESGELTPAAPQET